MYLPQFIAFTHSRTNGTQYSNVTRHCKQNLQSAYTLKSFRALNTMKTILIVLNIYGRLHTYVKNDVTDAHKCEIC